MTKKIILLLFIICTIKTSNATINNEVNSPPAWTPSEIQLIMKLAKEFKMNRSELSTPSYQLSNWAFRDASAFVLDMRRLCHKSTYGLDYDDVKLLLMTPEKSKTIYLNRKNSNP